MHPAESAGAGAALTVAIAMALGMVAQSTARHVKLPGIVLLLAVGVLLGPDLAGIVRPEELGDALPVLVGFAVAVILFEGGLNLKMTRMRQEATVIRRLITTGALVTGVGAALSAHGFMGWTWPLSASFGALVIVTGPTVITPLLRRIKLKHSLETVLEAEGVLIDAVGAVVAAVTLQAVISPSGETLLGLPLSLLGRLAFGVAAGSLGGFLIAWLLRFERVVPEGLENVFTLSLVLALFQASNAFLPESGIMSVTAAGVVVGNLRTRVHRELAEFKEQLTVLFIGMLFVLLAADVRMHEVVSLGWPGFWTVVCLALVIRPLDVAVSTFGSSLTIRERVFMSWLAPRGVVAAAVASLFAQTFEEVGVAGGEQLRALVFVVIAGTVFVQGLTGYGLASLLGLHRTENRGYAVFGATELGMAVARLLRDGGEEIVFVDYNPTACRMLADDGFRVIYGNVNEERTLLRARLEERQAAIASTTNGEVNLLFARHAKNEFKVPRTYIACRHEMSTVNPSVIQAAGAQVLFGEPRDLDLWSVRLRRGKAVLEAWRLDSPPAEETTDNGDTATPGPWEAPENLLLPLVHRRGSRSVPVSDQMAPRSGDDVTFAVFVEQRDEAGDWLRQRGWTPVLEADDAHTADLRPASNRR